MWDNVDLISAGNNIYDINNIAIILLECILFANKGVSRTILYESLTVVIAFTQMLCYNVYVPLLRMAHDVEENPGPTVHVYDVVDPSRTICAAIQGDLDKMLVFIYAWDSSFLNIILCSGNSLYAFISNSINKTFLLVHVTDVPEIVSDQIIILFAMQ